MLADMTTSFAVQLMEHSKGLRPSMPCTQYLLALESCVPSQTSVLPAYLCNIVTPHNVQAWERELRAHPDQALVSYILRGIRDSFCIDFHWSHSCKTAKRNMQWAYEHPLPVEEYLAIDCTAGRVVGPLRTQTVPHAKISPPLESSQSAINGESGAWFSICRLSRVPASMMALLSSFVAFHMSQLMT